MRIFKVRHDSNVYQYFLPEEKGDHRVFSELDGTPKAGDWSPPPSSSTCRS